MWASRCPPKNRWIAVPGIGVRRAHVGILRRKRPIAQDRRVRKRRTLSQAAPNPDSESGFRDSNSASSTQTSRGRKIPGFGKWRAHLRNAAGSHSAISGFPDYKSGLRRNNRIPSLYIFMVRGMAGSRPKDRRIALVEIWRLWIISLRFRRNRRMPVRFDDTQMTGSFAEPPTRVSGPSGIKQAIPPQAPPPRRSPGSKMAESSEKRRQYATHTIGVASL